MKYETRLSLWAIVGLVAVASFAQGLYSPIFFLTFAATVFAALVVYIAALPRTERWALDKTDFLVLALALLYTFAVAWAVSPGSALRQALNQWAYVGVYFLVSRMARHDRDRVMFVRGLTAVIGVLALSSFVLAAGWIPMEKGLYANRLTSTFQYANAFAGALNVGLGAAAALRSQSLRPFERVSWSGCLFTVVLALLLTYSRIGWVAAAGVVVISIVFMPRGHRVPVLLSYVPALLAVASVAVQCDQAIAAGRPEVLPAWWAAGVVVVLAVEACLFVLSKWKWTRWTAWGGALLLAVFLGMTLIPEAPRIMQRLGSISVTDESLLLRFLTYQDALRAWWAEGPILGLGGGGWRAVYLQYRSLDWVTKLVHSCYWPR